MAQRDYEEQPEAPDLGATVQLETAESLVGPADGNDALDAGYSPPDRPYALDDDELTVAGQAAGETLDERLAREVPEEVPVDADRAGRLADPEQLGVMERTDSMEGQDVGIDGGAASAEEAAVHVVDLDPDLDPDLRPRPRGRRRLRLRHRRGARPHGAVIGEARSGSRRSLRTYPGDMATDRPARPRPAALCGGTRSAAAFPRGTATGCCGTRRPRAGGGGRSCGPSCRPRPSAVVVGLLIPGSLAIRLMAVLGGIFVAMIYVVAFIDEAVEHPRDEGGLPRGYAKALRDEARAPQRDAEARRYAERYRGRR
jgi:hypothetical protein